MRIKWWGRVLQWSIEKCKQSDEVLKQNKLAGEQGWTHMISLILSTAGAASFIFQYSTDPWVSEQIWGDFSVAGQGNDCWQQTSTQMLVSLSQWKHQPFSTSCILSETEGTINELWVLHTLFPIKHALQWLVYFTGTRCSLGSSSILHFYSILHHKHNILTLIACNINLTTNEQSQQRRIPTKIQDFVSALSTNIFYVTHLKWETRDLFSCLNYNKTWLWERNSLCKLPSHWGAHHIFRVPLFIPKKHFQDKSKTLMQETFRKWQSYFSKWVANYQNMNSFSMFRPIYILQIGIWCQLVACLS